MSLISKKPDRVKIEGKEFSGEAVVFVFEGDIYQTIFMVGNGDGLWNGQFTGSSEGWSDALKILENLKLEK